MNIENITLNHSITIDEYNDLRASVDFITIRENRARIALDHSLYTLIARENGRPVGMARVVGVGTSILSAMSLCVHRTSRRDLDDILLSMFFPGWKVRWMRERPLW